ncbi:hypothetical protein ABPG77_008827 [Micractinium sp. CCAP 211/92]
MAAAEAGQAAAERSEQCAAGAAGQPTVAARFATLAGQQAAEEGAGEAAQALQQGAAEEAAAQQAGAAAAAAAQPARLARAAAAPEAAPPATGQPAPSKPRRLKQLFDYLLVLDIEATCDRDKAVQLQPQEIIELSCVIVDTAACTLLPGGWQRYVRPDQHPVLTDFCTQLTGITQSKVDAGVPLKTALNQLDGWLREQGLLGQGRSFSPLIWRDWDLKVMMASECKQVKREWRNIEQPKYLRRWIDLSAVWFKHSSRRGNLRGSVEAAGLAWEGRPHSAIDDARNTARLAVKLMQGGLILGITGSFGNLDASGRFRQGTLLGLATRGASSSGGKSQAEQAAGPTKKRVFDDGGAWNGCCYCGARAKKRTVKRPGPNNGRDFWSCGRFTMTGGASCDFFKFADEVVSPPGAANDGSSRRWRRH